MKLNYKWNKARLTEELVHASINGDDKKIMSLIDSGADIRADDNTALCAAVANGHADAVRLLLGAGADPNAQHGEPIILVAMYGFADVAEALIEGGADIDIFAGGPMRTALDHGHDKVAGLFAAQLSARDRSLPREKQARNEGR